LASAQTNEELRPEEEANEPAIEKKESCKSIVRPSTCAFGATSGRSTFVDGIKKLPHLGLGAERHVEGRRR
jgi:hypothetical protein